MKMLRRVASTLANREVFFCWNVWLDFGVETKRVRKAMGGALRAVQMQITRRGLNAWFEFHYARVRAVRAHTHTHTHTHSTYTDTVAAHATASVLSCHLTVAFELTQTRNHDLLRRALAALTIGDLYIGFNTWYCNLYPEKVFDDGSFDDGSIHEQFAKRAAPPAGSILGLVHERHHGDEDSFHVKVMQEDDENEMRD